ncbi:MAG TPA: phage tail protein [Massilia sp.]|nr:phage tail protein [Massilia sp.]
MLDSPITWKGETPTSVLYWDVAAGLYWVESMSLQDLGAEAIRQIDAAGDAARLLAIGDPARAIEYQQAEQQAREYRARGYAGEVPDDVASWSDPKGWAAQQAADDIIATADQWRAALSAIRKLRLAAKESVRAIVADPAGAHAQLYAVQAQFDADLQALMAGIQQ